MPDGPWDELDGGSAAGYEVEYNDPDTTYSSPTRREERPPEVRPDGKRVVTTIFTIADVAVEANDEGMQLDLIHKCNRCDGHTHELRAFEGYAVTVPYTPLHVEDDHFGQGNGKLYYSVKVTGELIQRVERKTYPAGGGAPQVEVEWWRRTLNHIEHRDLIELEPFDSNVDCTLNVDESSLGFHVPEGNEFALALANAPGLAEDVAWRDEGRVLPDLAEALVGLERPIFRLRRAGEEPEMVLFERASEGMRELGRVTLEISDDRKLVTAKRYTPTKA